MGAYNEVPFKRLSGTGPVKGSQEERGLHGSNLLDMVSFMARAPVTNCEN